MSYQILRNKTESWPSEDVLEQIAELDFAYFPSPWKREDWHKMQLSSRDYSLTLYIEKSLNGFSLWEIDVDSHSCYLHKVLIHPKWRQKGAAQNLLLQDFEYFKALKVKEVYLDVAQSNIAAIKTYHKLGFSQIHHKKSFYSDGEDALYMRAELQKFLLND